MHLTAGANACCLWQSHDMYVARCNVCCALQAALAARLKVGQHHSGRHVRTASCAANCLCTKGRSDVSQWQWLY